MAGLFYPTLALGRMKKRRKVTVKSDATMPRNRVRMAQDESMDVQRKISRTNIPTRPGAFKREFQMAGNGQERKGRIHSLIFKGFSSSIGKGTHKKRPARQAGGSSRITPAGRSSVGQ